MVKIDTSKYVAAHGKEPRGMGKWFFETPNGEIWEVVKANYVAAEATVIRMANEGGHDSLTLLERRSR